MKLSRIAAWAKRFLYNSQSLKEHREIEELSAYEITGAETHLIRSLQQDHFAEEYKCLSKEKEIRSNWEILSLRPRTDKNGLLRSSGHLENAEYLHYEVPYYLAQRSMDHKIVRYYHERRRHISGINHTMTHLKQRYWIIRGSDCHCDCR